MPRFVLEIIICWRPAFTIINGVTSGTSPIILNLDLCYLFIPSLLLYSSMSPGWQSKALQIASKVEKRIALALSFFNIERLAIVIPTLSESSVTLIFRLASITSMLIIIAIYCLRLLNRFLILYLRHFVEVFEKQQLQ